jgi:hypothetical protein
MLPNCWRRYPFGIPWTQSLYILLYVIVTLACHYSCITFPSISRILTTAYSRAKQFKPNMFSRGQQRPENVTYGWNFIVNFVFVFFIFILFLFGFVDTPIYEEDFKFRSSPRAEKVYRAVYFGSHSSLSACIHMSDNWKWRASSFYSVSRLYGFLSTCVHLKMERKCGTWRE